MAEKKYQNVDLEDVVIRFSGDSGDGMQLTGTLFSETSALVGNDFVTFPDFPAEIRAPQGTVGGVSGFQVHIGHQPVYTPGDYCDVLIAMNPAALKANRRWAKKGAIIIHTIEQTVQKYKIPDNFDAEGFFKDAYGVTVLKEQQQPEQVIISIDYDQAPYLRTLPIHSSQREIEPINGYPAFSFKVYPSVEFCQELFKYGSDLEVHKPEWLRKYFAEDAGKVNEIYNH